MTVRDLKELLNKFPNNAGVELMDNKVGSRLRYVKQFPGWKSVFLCSKDFSLLTPELQNKFVDPDDEYSWH